MAITLNMKTKSYLIGLALLAAGLITFNNHKATADNPRVEGATVVLYYQLTYNYLPSGDVERYPSGLPIEFGYHVSRVSASSNTPSIEIGESLGVVCARLQNAGLVMEPPTPRGELIFNRRPR